jgi:hypothetical protein
MGLLTRPLGRLTWGLWIVVFLLVFSGLGFTLAAQGISFFDWQAALSLGVQEDRGDSPDMVERTMAAVSWGEAGADVAVQGSLIVLALIGIFLKRWWGWAAGVAQSVIWVYVTMMASLQRLGLHRLGVEPDLARFEYVFPVMLMGIGLPGVVMLVCLVANRRVFRW